jgi:hypothetical protein
MGYPVAVGIMMVGMLISHEWEAACLMFMIFGVVVASTWTVLRPTVVAWLWGEGFQRPPELGYEDGADDRRRQG